MAAIDSPEEEEDDAYYDYDPACVVCGREWYPVCCCSGHGGCATSIQRGARFVCESCISGIDAYLKYLKTSEGSERE